MDTPLKLARKHRGWTQKELAGLVGIERSHLCKIELGEDTASPAVAKRLSEAFDRSISLDEILFPADFAFARELSERPSVNTEASQGDVTEAA